MRAAPMWLLGAWVGAAVHARATSGPQLKIRASSSSRSDSDSAAAFFGAEAPIAAVPGGIAASGWVWPSATQASPSEKVKAYKRHWTITTREDDGDDDDDDESAGWLGIGPLQYLRPSKSLRVHVADVAARTFVRALTDNDSDDEDVVAKVVVISDSKELAVAAVEVVALEPPVNASVTGRDRGFRVAPPAALAASTVPPGRVLVQVLVNTRFFQLTSLRADGRSVVVMADSSDSKGGSSFRGTWLAPSSLALSTDDEAQLFVQMDAAVRRDALQVRADGTSTLVVQARAPVVLNKELTVQQSASATAALVVNQLTTMNVALSSRGSGGTLCVHSAAQSMLQMVDAAVDGDGSLLAWTALDRQDGSKCSLLTLRARGSRSHVDVSALAVSVANVTVDGEGSDAVVGGKTQVMTVAADNGGSVHYMGTRPQTLLGPASRVDVTKMREVAAACALETLATSFPLPVERAVAWAAPAASVMAHTPTMTDKPSSVEPQLVAETVAPPLATAAELQASTSPPAPLTTQPPEPVATTSAPSPSPSTTESAESRFVSASLNMLGSTPYLDAIAVFLVSAWILHHLLQCYDRRRRRRHYEPLGAGGNDRDAVWI